MEIVYALLLGMLIGGAWALLALALLFNVIKKRDAKAAAAIAAGGDKQAEDRQTLNVILRFHVSKYLLDVLLLLGLFLARNMLPFRWEYILLGVALMITVFFQIMLACSGMNKRIRAGQGS